MRKLLLPLLLVTGLFSCNKEKSLSDDFLEDVKKGEVRYMQMGSGVNFYDPKHTQRLTSRLIEDVKASEWGYLSPGESVRSMNELFNIPQDIMGIEFQKEVAFEDTLSRVIPFNEEYYKQEKEAYGSDPVLADLDKGYEDFKKTQLAIYSRKPKAEVDNKAGLIRYHEPVKAKTFTYKITTLKGTELVNVHLFNLPGSLGEPWKIGGVTREDI